MIYGVLGDLEVRASTGVPVELPRGHALAVLAALLIRPNRQLSTPDLIEAAWGETDVRPAQLHKAVSALRKLFTEVGKPEAIKTYNRFGYGVQAADDELDLLAFHRLVESADADRAKGETGEEIIHLREALDLWRGPSPLSNVPLGAFGREIETLRARRKRCAIRLFTLQIERGEHAPILDDLEQLAAEYPEDAQICRLRMIALYRAGHADDATAAYESFEEAGGGADRTLRRLAYAMAVRNDDEVAKTIGAESRPAAVVKPPPLPRQLPPSPAHFVGREGLLAELTWLLREPRMRVLVISGAGGMGKTALALTAAHAAADAYPGGQLWADLRGTTDQPADPAEVLAEFLRGLGEPAVPETLRERAALFRSLAADRRMLVVLDDAADSAQIRDLIPGGGDCVVLVTARRRLPGIEAATHQVAPLGALDDDTASALFRKIVAAGNVDLAGEDDAVAAVVRLCGGLPLALRIAAMLRVEDFHQPTAELLRRLSDQGPAAFEYGQQSLARTLGAGLAPLDDQARQLFLGLGLLALPMFGEWAAAAVLDEPGPAAGVALSQLAAVGMIEPAAAGPRYRFHELTRDYARAHAPESADVPARACRALLTLTRRAHEAIYGGQFDVVHSDLPDVAVPPAELAAATARPLDWLERERLNLRAMVEQAAALGLTEVCWDLAVSAHEFYALRGYFDDWRVTHEVALAACRAAGDRRGEALVLTALGQPPLVASGSPGVSGVSELETAARLLTEAGERHGRAIALRTLANALRRRGELARPLRLFQEALDGYRRSGDDVGVQQTLRFIGHTQLDRGDAGAAVTTLREAERLARDQGDPRLIKPTVYWIGCAHLARGDLGAAGEAFEEVLEGAPLLGQAYALHGLGQLALAAGDRDSARERLDLAGPLAAEGADVVLVGRIWLSLAALAPEPSAASRTDDRTAALLRAQASFRSCGAIHLEVEALVTLAEAYASRGLLDAAAAARRQVGEVYDAVGVPLPDRRHA
ncbi:AfsR/SARP family transcriptional regulator [Actinoplanes sp. CA-142083]|uniref:AfsR/SARP family transcriptional regulator n=1 Tax=Actinoplanes sp. CA-142083 TaxID=3239903 RepID=UPI003D8A4471